MPRKEFTQLSQSPFTATEYGELGTYDYEEAVGSGVESTGNFLVGVSDDPNSDTIYVTQFSTSEVGADASQVRIRLYCETTYEGTTVTLWSITTTAAKAESIDSALPVPAGETEGSDVLCDIHNTGGSTSDTEVEIITTEVN